MSLILYKSERRIFSEIDSIINFPPPSAPRRRLVRSVARREQTVSQIAKPYHVSLAAISKHLKVLEKADLITREKRGSFHIVRLNAIPMKDAEHWLAFYEDFWNTQLDALQKFLEGGKHDGDSNPEAKKNHQGKPAGRFRCLDQQN